MFDIDAVVEKAAADTPPMKLPSTSSMFGEYNKPSRAAVQDYNEARDRYLGRIRQWAVGTQNIEAISAGSILMDLATVNAGRATAEDVEISLEVVTPQIRLATRADLEHPDRPEPPAKPRGIDIPTLSSAAFQLPRADIDLLSAGFDEWQIDPGGQRATIRLRQIRHGGRFQPIETLYLVTDAGPVTGGVHIEWLMVGVRPPVHCSDSLGVRPRITDGAVTAMASNGPTQSAGTT